LNRPDFRAYVRQRLPSLRAASPQHDDIVDELAAQLEDAYASALAAGLDAPQALRRVEDQLRQDSQSWQQLDAYLTPRVSIAASSASRGLADRFEGSLADLRHAAGQLARDVRFAIPVVVTLSVCLGVAGAIFTIVNAVILRPLPFPESDRVVLLASQSRSSQSPGIRSDIPSYFDRRQRLAVFEEMAMFRWIDVSVDSRNGPRRVRGDIGTPSLLRLIGVPALHGRLFHEGETTNVNSEVVLSHDLWQELYGGDRRVIGSTLALDGRPFTIIGVMPPGFGIFRLDARLWMATSYAGDDTRAIPAIMSANTGRRGALNQYQIGRLKAGVTLDAARREMAAFDAWETERFPELRASRQRTRFYTSVDRLQDVMTRDVRPILQLLTAGALLALVAGIVNTVNLTMARARRHATDLATRVALGARVWHVTRQLAAEGLLLGAASGVGGLVLAVVMLWALPRVGLTELPRADTIAVDGTTAVVTLATALLIGLVMCLLPGVRVAFSRLSRTMQYGTRSRTGDRIGRATRRGLIAVQVAAAVILTAGAALLTASFARLLEQDPGFVPRGLTTASFDLPAARFPATADAHAFVGRALEAVRAIPGVVAAGATQLLPFGGREASFWVRRGDGDRAGSPPVVVWNYVVSPGYFETMQVRPLEGRSFDDGDTSDGRAVVIVDETLARRLWPEGRAIGRQLVLPDSPQVPPLAVVGIVASVRHANLTRRGINTGGAAYRPYTQASDRSFTLAVRTEPSLEVMPAVAAAVQALDPHVPLYDIGPMRERVDRTLAPRRLAMALGAVFGGTTLLLALVGIYGVLTLVAAERRREFAIRLVLGDSARGLVGHVVREAAAVTGIGLTIGLGGGWWLRDLAWPYIEGVDRAVPAVIAGAVAVVVLVAALACIAPARRVARVSPAIVLESQ
jgi:putative ABC transport system permease protein